MKASNCLKKLSSNHLKFDSVFSMEKTHCGVFLWLESPMCSQVCQHSLRLQCGHGCDGRAKHIADEDPVPRGRTWPAAVASQPPGDGARDGQGTPDIKEVTFVKRTQKKTREHHNVTKFVFNDTNSYLQM